jgi:DNA recombination protein RmuC
MDLLSLILIIALTLTVGVLIFVTLKKQPVATVQPDILPALQQIQQQTVQTLLQQLNAQQQSQDNNSGQLQNRMAETSKAVYTLQAKLAQLEEGNKRILDMSKGITELQDILQAPKLRGNQGEVWLENLLAQMLPRQHFQMQYRFKSGEICDAIIKMPDGHLVPLDSKFSLENFRKMLAADQPDEQKIHEKTFISDVKKRIDEISKKYILPDEGTLNFAFMYVPAENVYYQAFVEDKGGYNLQRYAFDKHVIPVSPNSLYPYLEIVLFGLKGLQIEQGARDIQQGLAGVASDLKRFEEAYQKVGNNLRFAQQNFDLSDKKLFSVQSKLTTLTAAELPAGETISLAIPAGAPDGN